MLVAGGRGSRSQQPGNRQTAPVVSRVASRVSPTRCRHRGEQGRRRSDGSSPLRLSRYRRRRRSTRFTDATARRTRVASHEAWSAPSCPASPPRYPATSNSSREAIGRPLPPRGKEASAPCPQVGWGAAQTDRSPLDRHDRPPPVHRPHHPVLPVRAPERRRGSRDLCAVSRLCGSIRPAPDSPSRVASPAHLLCAFPSPMTGPEVAIQHLVETRLIPL